MGKKSRSKAVKSAAGRSEQADGAGLNPANKKTRCMSCRCLIKDTSKAHACPGCSIVYCWRCERREFQACPNGAICVHPIRRCGPCASGFTLDGIMKAFCSDEDGNPPPPEKQVDLFENFLAVRDTTNNPWSVDTLPLQVCSGDGCKFSECRRCFTDPSVIRMVRCNICCGNARCSGCLLAFEGRLNSALVKATHRGLLMINESKVELVDDDKLEEIGNIFRADIPDTFVSCMCKGCNFVACIECLDDESFDRFMPFAFSDGTRGFQCSTCYWSAKPCTNPNCPNEPGVPTKRCGGCHLDRYCSVECQAAAYPAHVGRCQKIQKKRLASGMKVSAARSAASNVDETSVDEEDDGVEWDREVANGCANAIGSAYKQEGETASQKPWF